MLNEFLHIDPILPWSQYLEIAGSPGYDLTGLSVVFVPTAIPGTGTPPAPGSIAGKIDIPSGAVVGSNGKYLIGNEWLETNYGVVADLTVPGIWTPPSDTLFYHEGLAVFLVHTAAVGLGDLVAPNFPDTSAVLDGVTLVCCGDPSYFDGAMGAPQVVGGGDPADVRGVYRLIDGATGPGVDTDTAADWGIVPPYSPEPATPST